MGGHQGRRQSRHPLSLTGGGGHHGNRRKGCRQHSLGATRVARQRRSGRPPRLCAHEQSPTFPSESGHPAGEGPTACRAGTAGDPSWAPSRRTGCSTPLERSKLTPGCDGTVTPGKTAERRDSTHVWGRACSGAPAHTWLTVQGVRTIGPRSGPASGGCFGLGHTVARVPVTLSLST